jgi:hypothetical protein
MKSLNASSSAAGVPEYHHHTATDHPDTTHHAGPSIEDCRAWCASFLVQVLHFLAAQARTNRRRFRYVANPGEVYRVCFDHRGVVRVTEWTTGRHVVTSLPGLPQVPDMGTTKGVKA